jgi:hypothetical protein
MVRELLGAPTAVVADGWSCRPLGGGAGEGLGLYRVTGSAQVGGASQSWTLILKVYAAVDGADLAAWDYPAREGLAYRSGLLAALPAGLFAPRCLAFDVQPDGTSWLWLEAVVDAHPGPWPLEHYARVARHLGHFNGAYLTATPLPDQPWLSRGWLRDFVAPSGPQVSELERLASTGGFPLLQRLFPPPVVAELRRLWEEREGFLAALDRLPQTFCHLDAFRRNLLHRAGPEGDELVVIDWAYIGHGAVGEELVPLVLGSLYFLEAPGVTPHELDAACFSAYVAGLREARWLGDERLVRLGFTADAALRYGVGCLYLMVPAVTDPAQQPLVEALFGYPLPEMVDAYAALWPFQFALAEEARALLPLAG